MQASDKINYSAIGQQPESALNFDEPEERCQCWDKKWFAALVVLAWVLIVGSALLIYISYTQWDQCSADYIKSKDEYNDLQLQLKTLNETAEGIKSEILKVDVKIQDSKKEIDDKKLLYEELKNKSSELDKELDTRKDVLNKTKQEHQKIKKENDLFQGNITEKQEKIKKLISSIEELKRDIVVNQKEITAFKIPTFAAGGVLAAGIAYDVYTYIQLLSARAELNNLKHYSIGFNAAAKGFEDYHILLTKKGFTLERTKCFDKATMSSTEKCNGMKPTITTIITNDGFRFGAVFHEEWKTDKKNYTDARAYTFSSTVGLETIINKIDEAMIMDNNLVHFGRTDIVVTKDGSTGTAVGSSYRVPKPYNNHTFYYNGTFTVDKLTIEVFKTSG